MKITTMEDGVASVCFGTGMAAIGTTLFSLLRSRDHGFERISLWQHQQFV